MIIDSSDTWGLRQMVTCVQPDRFACRMGDRELDSTDFRTGAHDSESIPNFRLRYHSECHSLSWPHSDQIRRTHGSDRRIVDRFPGSGPVTLNQGKNAARGSYPFPCWPRTRCVRSVAQRPPDLLFQLGLARHDRVKRSASISAGAMRRLLLTAVPSKAADE